MSNLVERNNGKTPFKAKGTTEATSKSKKLEVGPSSEQLEIISVKEDNGQIMIEFRAPSTSETSIAGTGYETPTSNEAVKGMLAEIKVEDEFVEPSISVQSISPTDAERHNYPTEIKVEDEVDIKIEDEMEFCDLSYNDDNKSNHNKFAEIKLNEIEFEEANISVKSISKTIDDEYKEIGNEMIFCDKVKIYALDTPETTVPYKPGETDGNKKKSEFTCDICSKKYSKKASMSSHRTRHGIPNFHCNICGVTKFTKAELTYHMWTHDSNSICFKCDICWKKFSTQSHLVKHRLCHGKQNFHCTVCGEKKFTQYELDVHMRTHDTNRIHSCDICSMNFACKENLVAHRRRHDKPKFNCNVCDVAKFTRTELSNHMNAHHTKTIHYTCDICSKKYLSKANLARHQLLHGKPTFVCKYCGVAKYSNYDLNKHMKVHISKQD